MKIKDAYEMVIRSAAARFIVSLCIYFETYVSKREDNNIVYSILLCLRNFIKKFGTSHSQFIQQTRRCLYVAINPQL